MNPIPERCQTPTTADIVILGAGVMGASIAFHLAKRKAGKIVVIDKGHVGQGGSGRSSALIRMHYSYPPEVQLALVSLHMFENWRDVVGRGRRFPQDRICAHRSSRRKRSSEAECGNAAQARRECKAHRPSSNSRNWNQTGRWMKSNWPPTNPIPAMATGPEWPTISSPAPGTSASLTSRRPRPSSFCRRRTRARSQHRSRAKLRRRSWSRPPGPGPGRCFSRSESICRLKPSTTRSRS